VSFFSSKAFAITAFEAFPYYQALSRIVNLTA
jgi:hypothetical protein